MSHKQNDDDDDLDQTTNHPSIDIDLDASKTTTTKMTDPSNTIMMTTGDNDEEEALGPAIDGDTTPKYTEEDLEPRARAWNTMQEVKDAIIYVCYSKHLPYYVAQSSKIRFEIQCPKTRCGLQEKCTFIVGARVQPQLEHRFQVIRTDLNHSCGCMLTNNRGVRGLSVAFLSRHAEGVMKSFPKATPKNLRDHTKATLGTTVSYRTAQRAKKLIEDNQNAGEVEAFQLIQPYFEKLEEYLPGTLAVMHRDKENRLLRTFVMLQPLVESFKYGLPIISVDACHLRGKYDGCLMAATMIDGLNQTQLLAWGTCPVENAAHWNFFAKNLRKGLPDMVIGHGPHTDDEERRVITIFSDREKGIAAALDHHFPESHHVFCMFHIEKNVKKDNPHMTMETMALMWRASKAFRPTTFDRAMTNLRKESTKIYEYLLNIPLERWVTSHSPCRRWGMSTSNASESMNKWMNNERNLNNFSLHCRLVAKVMERQAS